MILLNGDEIYMTPLKLKYLREFMEKFDAVKDASSEADAVIGLVGCALVAMKQYYPEIKTTEDVEDNLDMKMLYKIMDYAADIKMDAEQEDVPVSKKANDSEASWEKFDLAKLESELFLVGIWKDYEEMEKSLSLPELVATLDIKRELDYSDKKFMASLQGVDLDEQSGKKNAWEEMKARVFSGGATSDANDILAFQGQNAAKAGFGIGAGLAYEKWD